MLESVIRLEFSNMLGLLGFNPHHPEDSKMTENPRPDLFGLNSMGPTAVIEVKKIEPLKREEPWFDPKNIRDSQRRWLDWYEWGREDPGDVGLEQRLTYIAIGTTWGRPRQAWLIPWRVYAWTEKQLKDVSETVGEEFRFTMSKMAGCFSPLYECTWDKRIIYPGSIDRRTGKPVGPQPVWIPTDKHPIRAIRTLPHNATQWVTKSLRFEPEKKPATS